MEARADGAEYIVANVYEVHRFLPGLDPLLWSPVPRLYADEVTAVKTGISIGHCTELCGLYHSRMLFIVKIVTPAQFSQWIHAQQAQQAKSAGGVS